MATVHCPICDKMFEVEQSPAMPFCCERCRMIDLGRWLDERYGLSQEAEENSEAEPPERTE